MTVYPVLHQLMKVDNYPIR